METCRNARDRVPGQVCREPGTFSRRSTVPGLVRDVRAIFAGNWGNTGNMLGNARESPDLFGTGPGRTEGAGQQQDPHAQHEETAPKVPRK
eukprot:gene22837-biopygen4268